MAAAAVGPPYTSELTLVQPLLEALPVAHTAVIADKLYDSHCVLATITARHGIPIIQIKHSRYVIRDPLRRASQGGVLRQPKGYAKRTFIEGLFGNPQQKLSSHIPAIRLDIAQLFALLRFALFNIAFLVSLGLLFYCIAFSEHHRIIY